MATFSVIGIFLLGGIIAFYVGGFLVDMFRSDIGRGILVGLAHVAAVVWGLFGIAYFALR